MTNIRDIRNARLRATASRPGAWWARGAGQPSLGEQIDSHRSAIRSRAEYEQRAAFIAATPVRRSLWARVVGFLWHGGGGAYILFAALLIFAIRVLA